MPRPFLVRNGMGVSPHAIDRAIERGLAKGSRAEIAAWILDQWETQPRVLFRVRSMSDYGTTTHIYVAPLIKFMVRYPIESVPRIQTVMLPDDYPTYTKAQEMAAEGMLPLDEDGQPPIEYRRYQKQLKHSVPEN